MEFVRSGIQTVLGSQRGAAAPSGAETVERLVERLQTSTLLDDRRDACRALKALSKPYRLEVGAQAMDALIHVLEVDRSDGEIVGYSLDALTNVIACLQDEDDYNAELSKEAEALGIQFTDIYIKKPDNVTLLLELLEEQDFKVRWPAVKLLTSLLIGRPKELQECILVSPMGVSRLMDLLVDSREVVRNDALLLLGHLTKGNANIQKIVAFDNAFDRLLDIIAEEGYSDGGVIVEDCLLVLLNLLKSNVSNQNLFKEGSYIQKLTPFFDLQKDAVNGDKGWSPQKVSNIHLMLQVIRTLVSPSNPMQVISSCQKVMNQCGLLEQLCNILMASGVPADILTEGINTVAEVIRGHHSNQEYFATVTAPSNPPSSAIVVLLMSMVNEKQPFILRCSVLYCFQCFLYRNELGQAQVIQTLLPTSANTISQVTAGQLLCGGLFSMDPVSNWFAAVALSHALVDNSTQKEQLIRVQLATSVGNPPISLMKQCTTILQQGGKVQTRLGLLMLLCMWLSSCVVAVNHFLSIPTNIPYLTSQVNLAEGDEQEDLVQGVCALLLGICVEFNDDSVASFTKENLISLIKKRIGLEMFLDKLKGVSLNDGYSQAAQKPHLKHRQPQDIFFDYEFCKLFKSLEGTVVKAVQPSNLINGPESNMSREQHALLQQYKEMIRDQDQKLHDLRHQFDGLSQEHSQMSTDLLEANSCVQQLRDQNALLKAQRSTGSSSSNALTPQATTEKSDSDEKLSELQKELEQLRLEHTNLQEELKKAEAHKELAQEGMKLDAADSSSENASELQRLLSEREQELNLARGQVDSLLQQVAAIKNKDEEIQRLEQECTNLRTSLKEVEEKLESESKEQEDLLVLLTEQDSKINTYKHMIKDLGGKIEDEDDLEDEDSIGDDNFLED